MVSTFASLELAAGAQDIAVAADFACYLLDSPPDQESAIWVHDWEARNSPPMLSLARTEEGFLIHFPDLADFSISEDGYRIGAWPAPNTPDETLRHLLLDQVLPRLLAHRGQLVLHAGAVNVNDNAIAFVGETGSGKSTLTASFRAAGHPSLTDDGLILNPVENGVTALSTYPSLRLWPESVVGLYAVPPTLAPMAHYSTKRRVVLSKDETVSQPLPLAALYVLAPPPETAASAISLTRLSLTDACMAIVENSFQLDVTDTHRVTGLLAAAAEVAQRIPVFQLTHTHDFALLPSVRAAILEQHEFWVGPGVSRHSG